MQQGPEAGGKVLQTGPQGGSFFSLAFLDVCAEATSRAPEAVDEVTDQSLRPLGNSR